MDLSFIFFRGLIERLDRILANQGTMMLELETLKNEVAETKAVVESAIVLISGLKTKLDEAIAANDPAALTALSQELDNMQGALAAAVAANTPAA